MTLNAARSARAWDTVGASARCPRAVAQRDLAPVPNAGGRDCPRVLFRLWRSIAATGTQSDICGPFGGGAGGSCQPKGEEVANTGGRPFPPWPRRSVGHHFPGEQCEPDLDALRRQKEKGEPRHERVTRKARRPAWRRPECRWRGTTHLLPLRSRCMQVSAAHVHTQTRHSDAPQMRKPPHPWPIGAMQQEHRYSHVRNFPRTRR